MKHQVSEIKAGTLISYLQMILSVLVSLLYTPAMIRILGQSEYGLYNTVASAISLLSLLQLGFNHSYIRYFTKYKSSDQAKDLIAKLNGVFLVLFTIIGVVALLCGLFISAHLDMVFSNGLTIEEYLIARVLMIFLTINLAISFPMSVFSNIISAHERFIFLKGMGIVKAVLGPMISIPVLLSGYGSIGIAVVSVCVSLFVDIIYVYFVIAKLHTRFEFSSPEKGLIRDLGVFTSFIALELIIDQINWHVDKIILGRYRGTTTVAVYSVGASLYNYYMMISTSVSGVFTPRIHRVYQMYKEKPQELRERYTDLFVRIGRVQYLILGLFATGIVFFGKSFIHFWAGEGYDESYYVALLLIIPSTIPLTQNIGIEIQRAENLHRFRSLVYFAMAILNLGLSIVLCQHYGAVGSTIGTAISLILANGLVMNLYYHRKCGINISVYWKQVLRMTVCYLVPIIIGIVMIHLFTFSSLLSLLAGMVCYAIIFGCSAWLLCMNSFEKELIKKPMRRVLGKVSQLKQSRGRQYE